TRILLGGIEVMHMIKKGQMMCRHRTTRSAAQQFYALAA
ncbi:IS6 family transposase, partial [Paraburkholderia sp. UCT31]|nr:IS6 family transposase [Paraburkholderia sp. UCT31]MBC8742935.1 IS6 family transposase [Paraburkholderia sp. UCT31]